MAKKQEVKHCPHCGQTMMLYRRNIRKNMLYLLRKLGFEYTGQYKKPVDLDNRANIVSDFTKLKYWGLIAEHKDDKCHYKITERGAKFIRGMEAIPKYKWIYDGKVQPDPADETNPTMYCWDIVPQVINRDTVLADARKYPYEPKEVQNSLF